ncbi:MAG: tetratricopeptide repeat protein [Bacteroidales bacterium]|nr:tetratricopeptide repeat protein [Bacteroidales bacterium]
MASCATNKDAFPNKFHHAVNTRFNVFFNGSESFKEGAQALSKTTMDNYTQVLPVYVYPSKVEAQAQSPKWDRAIEKCSKAVAKHTMFIKGVDKNIYMDEVYLLMGKAYFYRQDYAEATRIFAYMIQSYKNTNSWPDAYTWLAQTYLCEDRIADAEENLELIKADIGVTKDKKQKQHWEAVYVDKLIRQENYEQAAVYLSDLLTSRWMNRNFKTRCMFIYAQINQELGQFDEALAYYNKVIRRSPPYEMAFNATLNASLCGIERSETKARLQRLLKDPRNDEYRDQIFYAIAQTDFYRSDTASGLRNLESSVFWSIRNPYQKALSSLELAEYYFAHQMFEESQLYYDTLLRVLPESFPNRGQIYERAKVLKELVSDLMTIKTEDSLQRIAAMSEEEREGYIRQLIADYQERERARIADEEAKQQLMQDVKKANANNKKSTWVFYNPTQVKAGELQFRKEWGPRVLEDNWFLSDKQSIMQMADAEEQQDGEQETGDSLKPKKQVMSSGGRIVDPSQPEYYTQDVPFTPSALDSSNNRIAFALYNSGFVYYDDLHDKAKAVTQWSALTDRFPNHRLYPSGCYLLYRTYREMGDSLKCRYYRQEVLERFPESEYAMIIRDPQYFEKLSSQKKEAEEFYAATYPLYEQQKYKDLQKRCTEGLKKYVDPQVRSRLYYLQAYAKGRLKGTDTMEVGMKAVCRQFPGTAVDTLAAGVLEAILRSRAPQPTGNTPSGNVTAKVEEQQFVYDASRFHFVILLVDIKGMKMDKLKANIANFNKEYFRLNSFDVSNFYIDNMTQMVTISRFDNKTKAMEYYYQLKSNSKYFGELNASKDVHVYVISDQNYTLFYKQKKKRPEYERFFNDYYLNVR